MIPKDMSRKLIVEEWLSLDGHVSDKEGKLDFFAKHVRDSYTTAYRSELLHSIDTILFGRKTYQQFSALWPERPVEQDVLAEKINTAQKLVFSGSLSKAPWGRWPEARIESGDAVKRIRALKAEPGRHLVLWGSLTLAQALMQASLIDEYHLHICPTITGGGRRFFAEGIDASQLALTDTKAFDNGVVLLKYKPL